MDVLRTRCPSCHKLYAVDHEDIVVDRPEFQCTKCEVRFAFNTMDFVENGASSSGEIKSYLVDWHKMPEIEEEQTQQTLVEKLDVENSDLAKNFFSPCPKCGFSNPLSADECRRCGVLVKKLKKDHPDHFRSTERIRLRWERVLGNYEDLSRHESFLAACAEDECLPYASFRYKSILDADPTEEIAIDMLVKVDELVVQAEEARLSESEVNWRRQMELLKTIALWGSAGAISFMAFYSLSHSLWRAFGAMVCSLALLFLVVRKS